MDEVLHDHAYGALLRMRLGFPPSPNMDNIRHYCVSTRPRPRCTARDDPWHAMWCEGTQGAQIARHNALASVLQTWITRAGGVVTLEPRDERADPDDLRRTDLHVIMGTQRDIQVDVSVVHPTAPTYVAQGRAMRPLAAAKARAREKRAKHQAAVEGLGHEFIPFVLESHGGFGPAANSFVQRLAYHAEAAGLASTPAAFIRHMKRALARRLFRANANLLAAALRRAHRGPRRPVAGGNGGG